MPANKANPFRPINIDMKKAVWDAEKELLKIPDEFGYILGLQLQPMVSINANEPFLNNIPEYQINMGIKPVSIDKNKELSPPKTQTQIFEALKGRSIVSPKIVFDDFTVGFTYATPQHPNNHQWMLEFRQKDKIFFIQHFLGVKLKNIDIGNVKWFDSIWHGRFKINKDAYKIALEEKDPGWVTIYGRAGNKHKAKGDVSMIPQGVETCVFRYNVKTDIWYLDMMDKEMHTTAPPLQFKNILGENVTVEGHIDWGHPKPKVTMRMPASKINDMRLMADTLVIVGR